jgi:uncharacterized MnhB-related membrane protein
VVRRVFNIIEILTSLLLVVVGFIAVNTKDVKNSILALSVLSMSSVFGFVLMKAADVAITEAVIGSGLVTALFVFTIFTNKKGGVKQ